MDLAILSGAVAVISTIISIVVSFSQLFNKQKAEEKFDPILKEYLKKEPSSKRVLELMIEINRHMALQAKIYQQASQSQQKWLEKTLEINTIQSELLNLTEKLPEQDKKLIDEGLTQPSTTGRIRYMAKLLEKAKSET